MRGVRLACLSAQDGVIPAQDGVIPAQDGVIPAQDGVIPAKAGICLIIKVDPRLRGDDTACVRG